MWIQEYYLVIAMTDQVQSLPANASNTSDVFWMIHQIVIMWKEL